MSSNLVAPSSDSGTAPPSQRHLDRSLVHGVAWMAGAQWVTQFLSWGAAFVVAATLGPTNYGIVVMATVFTAFIEMASDFGIAQAVVKHRELTLNQIGQVNALSVIFGLTGWAICVAAAYPISLVYGVPVLTTVVMVSSSSFFFTSFRSVPLALMERDLQFRNIATNQVVQGTVLPLSMIFFAVVLRLEYWSLVFGTVLGAIMSATLALRVRPTPFAWPRYGDVKGVLSFGSHMVLQRFAFYLTTSSDMFIGGKVLGQAPIGAYSFAMQIAAMPSDKISGMAMRVMPPIISAVQRDFKELRRYVLTFTEVVSLLTLPAGVGIILVAGDTIHWLMPKWNDAILPLQVLALSGVHRSITPIIPSTAVMIGLSRVCARIAVGISILMPAVFFIGSFWGLAGLSAGWLLVYPVLCVPYYIVVFRKIELGVASYGRALFPAASSAAVMAATVWLAHHYLYANAAMPVRVVADAAIGAVTYAASLLLVHRERLLALRGIYKLIRSK